MRFYDQQHDFYCGIDLHTQRMYLCILDRDGNKQLHRNMRARSDEFLRVVEPFRKDLIVGVECMFTFFDFSTADVLKQTAEVYETKSDSQTKCCVHVGLVAPRFVVIDIANPGCATPPGYVVKPVPG